MLLHAPRWQEVGPDVDRLVVHLEAAEDAVQRWAPRVTVSRDDAILPEHLRTNQTVITLHKSLLIPVGRNSLPAGPVEFMTYLLEIVSGLNTFSALKINISVQWFLAFLAWEHLK